MSRGALSRRDWLKTTGVVGIGFLGSGGLALTTAADSNDFNSVIDIGSRRELFLDDYLIEKLDGASQKLHHPVPRKVAIVHDAPWEGSGSLYHTVFQDGDLYRMYYRGSPIQVTQGKLHTDRHKPFYCYAESDDGIEWKKPELRIVEFDGSKRNNIILEELGTHNFAPFEDANPDCPPESRYKALGGTQPEGGLFAFQSADGVHWSRWSDKPVITHGAFDSQNLAFWDATMGKYRAYWRFFTAGVTTKENWKPAGYRAIRTATSRDFLHWENHADLTYVDSPVEHLYTNQIRPYYRAPHILIGMPTRYIERGWSDSMRALPDLKNRKLRASARLRYGTAITEGLLMVSRDGLHFKRWNEAFLRPGIARPGTWQYGQQYIACQVVETKSSVPGAPNELSLYASEDYWHGKGVTLRRYTLRLDGFVSIHAPMKGGVFLTKPLRFAGSRLTLNFSTSAAGSVRIKVQDQSGKPANGFDLTSCPAQFGDSIAHTVTWKHGHDVSRLAGKTVRLRFELKDADLYSIRFEADPS